MKKAVKKNKAKPVKKGKAVKATAKAKKTPAKKGKAKAPAIKKKAVEKAAPKKAIAKKAVKKPTKKVVVKKKVVKKVVKTAVKPKAIKKAKVNKKEEPAKSKKQEKIEKAAIEVAPAAKPRKRPKGGRKRKIPEDDDEPKEEQDILVAQLIKNTKQLRRGKKKKKVPKQIRTFTNPMASLNVVDAESAGKAKKKKVVKEPKGKFELEYVTRTSSAILYEFLTTPSGLSEWFADDVNIHEGTFTFFWDGSEQKAKLLGFKDEKFIKFRWLDKPDGTYFEFRIERDALTGDISLMITDFADEDSDMQTSKLLWDSQINDLLSMIGSY